jgi:hypothetical protein
MAEQLVSHLFLAEFDIDKGSVLRHALPGVPSGASEEGLVHTMLPEGAHAFGTDWTAFSVLEGAAATTTDATAPIPLLRCVNVVRVRLSAERRRGADVKALAVGSRHPAFPVETLRPLLLALLDEYFDAPAAETLRAGLARLASLPWGATFPGGGDGGGAQLLPPTTRALLRGSLPVYGKSTGTLSPWAGAGVGSAAAAAAALDDALYWAGTAGWGDGNPAAGGVTARLRLPRWVEPATAHSASLSSLVRRWGPDVMTLYSAVLSGRRVLFLGQRGVPAGDVAAAVLAVAHMCCPPLPADVLAARTFPHATLTDLAFLATPGGYVAGVTNPLFEGKREWWDVLAVVGARCADDGAPTASLTAAAPTLPGSLVRLSYSDDGSGERSSAATGAYVASAPAAAALGAGGRVVSGPSGAGAGPQAASFSSTSSKDAKEARCRVVQAYSELFWEPEEDDDDDGDGAGEAVVVERADAAAAPPAAGSTPTAASSSSAGGLTLYPAWKGLDAAFYSRMRSGLRYGEHWVRTAFEGYTASLLALAAHIPTAPAAAAAAAAGATNGGGGGSAAPGRAPLPPRAAQALALNRGRLLPLVRGGWYARYRAGVDAEAARLAAAAGVPVEDVARLHEAAAALRSPGALPGGAIEPHMLSAPLPWELVAAAGEGDAEGGGGGGGGGSALHGWDDWQAAALLHADGGGGGGGAGDAADAQLPPPHAHPAVPLLDEVTAHVAACPPLAEAFVAAFPEAGGGLAPVASGLLHAHVAVRASTAALLRALAARHQPPAVRAAVARLNPLLGDALRRAPPGAAAGHA